MADSPEQIQTLSESGIKDFVVDLPVSGVGWENTFKALYAAKARYLVRINSLAPMAKGVAVEPQGYRFTGIVGKRTIRVSLPGCDSVLVVVAFRRDGEVVKSSRVALTDGILNYDVDSPGGDEEVVLLYPLMTSAEQIDYWEAMDNHRDTLFESIEKHFPADGIRGIVNPLGRTLTLPGADLRFVPTSPYFRLELRNLLLDRYKSLETAQKIWAMRATSIEDFDTLARLVPLWSGTRGVSQLWDPETDRLYACDNHRSAIWADIKDVIAIAAARRYQRMISGLHQAIDVPIIQEWQGWAAAYETKESALDGIGMCSLGTSPSAILDGASRASSSLLRWPRTGWLPATDVDLGPGADPKQLPNVLANLDSLGARGIFVRADNANMQSALALAAKDPTDLTWANSSTAAVFFPENALNPAEIQRLPGGKWWLPSPMSGDRLDIGSDFFGYRYSVDGKTTFTIWTRKPGRVRFFSLKPGSLKFTSLDGEDPDPKTDHGAVDVTMTAAPMLITGSEDLPVPAPAYKETMSNFTQLAQYLEKSRVEATDEIYAFNDAASAFKQNPGAAYLSMRDQLRKLSVRVGKFTWIEAENSNETNFSEAVALPTCSGGSALVLRTQLPSEDGGYYASYNVQVRSSENQEVWIAGRIPADRRADIQVQIGGQTLTLDAEPVSPYGNGFAWYKAGITRLAGANSRVRVIVTGDTASDLAIDAICLTPGHFVPNGVWPPDPITYTNAPIVPRSKKRGRDS